MGQGPSTLCTTNNTQKNGEIKIEQLQIGQFNSNSKIDYEITGQNRKIYIKRAGMCLVEKPTETIINLILKFDSKNQKIREIIKQREQKHFKTAKDLLIDLLYEIFQDQQLRHLFFQAVDDPTIVDEEEITQDSRISDVSNISQFNTPQSKKKYKIPTQAQVSVYPPSSSGAKEHAYQSRHIDQKIPFRDTQQGSRSQISTPTKYTITPVKSQKSTERSKKQTTFKETPEQTKKTQDYAERYYYSRKLYDQSQPSSEARQVRVSDRSPNIDEDQYKLKYMDLSHYTQEERDKLLNTSPLYRKHYQKFEQTNEYEYEIEKSMKVYSTLQRQSLERQQQTTTYQYDHKQHISKLPLEKVRQQTQEEALYLHSQESNSHSYRQRSTNTNRYPQEENYHIETTLRENNFVQQSPEPIIQIKPVQTIKYEPVSVFQPLPQKPSKFKYLEKMIHRPYVDVWRFYDKTLQQIVYVKKYNQKLGSIPLLNYQTELTILKGLQEYQEDMQQIATQIVPNKHYDHMTIKFQGGQCTLQEYATELHRQGHKFSESELLYILVQLLFFVCDMQDGYYLHHGDLKPQNIGLQNSQFKENQYTLRLLEFECCVQTDQPENYPVYSTINYCNPLLKKQRHTQSILFSEMYAVAKIITNLANFNESHTKINNRQQMIENVQRMQLSTHYLGDILMLIISKDNLENLKGIKRKLNQILEGELKIPKLDYIVDNYRIVRNINEQRQEQESLICQQPFASIDKELFKQEIHFCTQTENYGRGVDLLNAILSFNKITDNPEQKLKLSFFQKTYTITQKIFANDPDNIYFINETLDNYAKCLVEFEFFQEAIKMNEKILKYKIKCFKGKINLPVAETYNNIGNTLFKMEQYNFALLCYKQCLGIKMQLFKSTIHPSIAESLDKVAQCFIILKDFHKAERHANNACRIMKTLFYSNPQAGEQLGTVDLANYMHTYAFCIQGLAPSQNLEAALEIHYKAQDIKIQNCGDQNSINKFESEYKIAAAFQQAHQHQKALNLLLKLKQSCEKIYVNSLPLKILPLILFDLGRLYTLTQEYQKAVDTLKESIICNLKLFKENSLELSSPLFWLGFTFQKLAKYKLAYKHLKQFIAIQNNHGIKGKFYNEGLEMIEQIKQDVDQEELLKSSIIEKDMTLDQATVLFNLAITKKEDQQYDEASYYLQKSEVIHKKLGLMTERKQKVFKEQMKQIKQDKAQTQFLQQSKFKSVHIPQRLQNSNSPDKKKNYVKPQLIYSQTPVSKPQNNNNFNQQKNGMTRSVSPFRMQQQQQQQQQQYQQPQFKQNGHGNSNGNGQKNGKSYHMGNGINNGNNFYKGNGNHHNMGNKSMYVQNNYQQRQNNHTPNKNQGNMYNTVKHTQGGRYQPNQRDNFLSKSMNQHPGNGNISQSTAKFV